jgi:hypothetical protein
MHRSMHVEPDTKVQNQGPRAKGWETPTLTYVGDIKDMVRGGGKSGPNFDSDPQTTRKRGEG